MASKTQCSASNNWRKSGEEAWTDKKTGAGDLWHAGVRSNMFDLD